MLLWIAFSLMTAAAIMAVLWPLRIRDPGGAIGSAQADIAVYRDQLVEIERDRETGLIGVGEAEAARAEVARRLLRATSEAHGQAVSTGGTLRRRMVALLALIGVPALAITLYLSLGSPAYPPQPLAQRLEASSGNSDIAILIRRVEEQLQANPGDGRGYEVIAPIYLRIGRVDDAVRAWTNAIRLLGSSAMRQDGLGEALMAQSDGVVTAEAKAAFKAALDEDPTDPRARYFLGLAAEQDGKPGDAARLWTALAAESPADAPWLGLVRESLRRVGAPVPIPAEPMTAATGPSAADVAAAGEMTPEDRQEMILGMVQGLSERLAREGDDIEGWLRLMRAWNVLGEGEKAKAAAADARAHFAKNEEALGRINTLARELGFGG